MTFTIGILACIGMALVGVKQLYDAVTNGIRLLRERNEEREAEKVE